MRAKLVHSYELYLGVETTYDLYDHLGWRTCWYSCKNLILPCQHVQLYQYGNT